jgi:hypothetical protein
MGSSTSMPCRELVALVTAYMDGALPSAERARFDEHVRTCAECRTYLAQMELVVAGATNWVANFAVTVTFLPLLNAAGLAGAYALYVLAAVLSLPFVWGAARETRGKALEQM